MKSRIKIWLIGALLAGFLVGHSSSGSGGDLDYSALLSQLSPAVVSVSALVDPEDDLWVKASGFVIDPAGKVITACHAVLGATEIFVELQSGERYDARVERCSEDDLEAKLHDVAVLQLEEHGPLSQVWLGDSDAVHLGQSVLVLSYPGPYGEFSVVTGEISGHLRRQFLTSGDDVYRVVLLAHAGIEWYDGGKEQGELAWIGEILDLEASHPGLSELEAFAQEDTLVLALEAPRADKLFCGVVSTASPQVAVERISCGALIDYYIEKTGYVAQLDREVGFLKTSAPVGRGSSGGPVFNLNGQVLGLVSWGKTIEIERGFFGIIEDIYLWPATNYIVPAEAIERILQGN